VLRVALLCSIAVVAVSGCGGGGSSSASSAASHTVIEASKAFSDAGIPFGTAVTSNPYVRGQQVYLPEKVNTSEYLDHVQSMLSGSKLVSRTGWVAWVFDTDAIAKKAVETLPLSKWGVGSAKVTRAIDGNVIVVASNFVGAQKPKLDAALKNLRG
jgi:hypothetical protein